jgi:hypothetical protein
MGNLWRSRNSDLLETVRQVSYSAYKIGPTCSGRAT